jgi:hypothetical protein
VALQLSGDRKISPLVRVTARGQNVLVKNSFGLPARRSCPGVTSVCGRICYAARTERYPSTSALLESNFQQLLACQGSVPAMAELLRGLLGDFAANLRRYPTAAPIFRLHWDGDFFSVPYAEAWRRVVLEHPEIRFWVYTRSFRPDCNVVPVLAGIDNLALYLSVDADNLARAEQVAGEYPAVRLATLAETAAEGRAMLRGAGRTGGACPELMGRIPLVVGTGHAMGACAKCQLCVKGNANISFSIAKR